MNKGINNFTKKKRYDDCGELFHWETEGQREIDLKKIDKLIKKLQKEYDEESSNELKKILFEDK